MGHWEDIGKSDDWLTPSYIFDALGERFDLDVAHPPTRVSHVPCRRAYSEQGLSRPWVGFVWMNPPFGGRNAIAPWVEQFMRHGNGIALVPDRTSAPWFQKWAVGSDLILFVGRKIRFEKPNGDVGKSPSCGTALLLARGDRACWALRRASPRLGMIVSPSR